MKIPPVLLGALGGAVAASAVWTANSDDESSSNAFAEGRKESSSFASSASDRHVLSALGRNQSNRGLKLSLGTSDRPKVEPRSSATVNKSTRMDPAPVSAPTPAQPNFSPEPTEAELQARVSLVEERANAQLESLVARLQLDEDQQDRIFPILASAAPGFHPIMQPEGGKKPLSGVGGDSQAGDDGSSINPGARITEIENEIIGELDEFQQASLVEDAMDREEWWEDVIAMLEQNLESETSGDLIASPASPTDPAQNVSEEERAAAATRNEVDDLSNLFGQ